MSFVKMPLSLVGVLSCRALVVYSLLRDRLQLSISNPNYHDADGVPFVVYTRETVCDTLHLSSDQVKPIFKELEQAGLIHRVSVGQGKPMRIYVVDVLPPEVQTAEKSAAKTAEKSTAKTAEKSAANHTDINQIEYSQSSSGNSGEICENQTSFDDIFLEMTTKDAVSKIVAQVVIENSKEFPEITTKIADFIAENVRNARKNTKIRNLRAYVRACLNHAVVDYNAQQDTVVESGGYKATYNIAEYESKSLADVKKWD